jgi:hypothetical protein
MKRMARKTLGTKKDKVTEVAENSIKRSFIVYLPCQILLG